MKKGRMAEVGTLPVTTEARLTQTLHLLVPKVKFFLRGPGNLQSQSSYSFRSLARLSCTSPYRADLRTCFFQQTRSRRWMCILCGYVNSAAEHFPARVQINGAHMS